MPPRSKQSRPLWMECDICKIRFSNKDSTLHKELCKQEEPFCIERQDDHHASFLCLQSHSEAKKHGFVFAQKLFATKTTVPETFEG